jgi:hypothetical protein
LGAGSGLAAGWVEATFAGGGGDSAADPDKAGAGWLFAEDVARAAAGTTPDV